MNPDFLKNNSNRYNDIGDDEVVFIRRNEKRRSPRNSRFDSLDNCESPKFAASNSSKEDDVDIHCCILPSGGHEESPLFSESHSFSAPPPQYLSRVTSEPEDFYENQASYEPEDYSKGKKKRNIIVFVVLAIIGFLIFIIGITTALHSPDERSEERVELSDAAAPEPLIKTSPVDESYKSADQAEKSSKSEATDKSSKSLASNGGYVDVRNIEINGHQFDILSPRSAVPSLEIGESKVMNDDNIVLAMQAADITENDRIVGAFIMKGDLVSKGESKSGYCAIIDNNINIGVSKTTPLLEEAIETNGYFFRQFPLVAGGNVVENKMKNAAKRKALAEINGTTYVILSQNPITLHDFSEALVELGVNNAITLTGGDGIGFYRTSDGKRTDVGKSMNKDWKNVSFIVWK